MSRETNMPPWSPIRIAGVFASLACLAHAVLAQQAPLVKAVIQTSTALNGPEIRCPTAQDGQAVITSVIVTMQPGEKRPRHAQDVPVFAYVFRGKVAYVDVSGKRSEFAAGRAFVDPVNTARSLETMGMEPARILVVFIGAKNLRNAVTER